MTRFPANSHKQSVLTAHLAPVHPDRDHRQLHNEIPWKSLQFRVWKTAMCAFEFSPTNLREIHFENSIFPNGNVFTCSFQLVFLTAKCVSYFWKFYLFMWKILVWFFFLTNRCCNYEIGHSCFLHKVISWNGGKMYDGSVSRITARFKIISNRNCEVQLKILINRHRDVIRNGKNALWNFFSFPMGKYIIYWIEWYTFDNNRLFWLY